MLVAAVLFVAASMLAADEPVRCTDLDMRQVSVTTGRVEQQTIQRDPPFGQLAFRDIEFDINATVRPIRTLRGAQVTGQVTIRQGCSTPWTDIAGRRSCVNLFRRGEVDTFLVNRRTHEAHRTPDLDAVTDYDQRMSRSLPLCDRR